MVPQGKEDFNFFVNIRFQKICVKKILCKVFLPKKLTDPVTLYLYPSAEKAKKINSFEFSISGNIMRGIKKRILAKKVYFKKSSSIDEKRVQILCEPTDLKIIYTKRTEKAFPEFLKAKNTFWLTPSKMLSPMQIVENSFTGNVKVMTSRKLKFTLSNGLRLAFNKHYRFIENEKEEEIKFSELVAEFSLPTKIKSFKEIEVDALHCLDDFLMLVSFAERKRCVCLGWEENDSKSYTKFYRRDISIPKEEKKHGYYDMLIDIRDSKNFIKKTYRNFIKLERNDPIRQAIQYVIYSEGKAIESSYKTLFSALETLLLYFCKEFNFETIMPENDWKLFQRELQKWIKSQKMLYSKEKRKLIYEKLPELNRLSFSAVFIKFCNTYNINLQDLWPVVEDTGYLSLLKIRNRLVHGEVFNTKQVFAIAVAKEHLKWIVERIILTILDWPISHSYVSETFLPNITFYNWKADCEVLS